MDPDQETEHQRLIAEREAILKQLAELGSDTDEDEEDVRNPPENNSVQNFRTESFAENKSDDHEEGNAVETMETDAADQAVDSSQRFRSGIKSSSFEEEKYEDSLENNDLEDTKSFDSKTPMELDEDEEQQQPEGDEQNCSSTSNENSRSIPVAVEKIVMDRKDADNHIELPDGWSIITHHSGMLVYYHKFTRVVTHSRPYQVEGLIRDHEIPIVSIPCLFRQVMDKKHEELAAQVAKCPMSFDERKHFLEIPVSERKMTPTQYHDFCEKRFKFKTITVHRYTNSQDKEGIVQQKKVNSLLKKRGFDMDYDQLKKRNNPGDVLLASSSGSVLIDLTPVQSNGGNRKGGARKPYLLNPMGKTSVAVLNEFVQRLAKGTLVYEMDDTRNVSAPYKATAMLTMKMNTIRELAGQCKESLIVLSEIAAASEDTPATTAGVPPDFKRFAIGTGVGGNKKTARLVAAKDALLKLIPKLRMTEEYICDGISEEGSQKGFEEESKELFKKVRMDSTNIVQLCTRFAIPKPYGLLKDAVSRSLRWNGMELQMKKEMVGNGSQLSRVILTLGNMEEEATAIGVKQATQMAAQLLFMKMHPELHTYGMFLEVYGKLNDKSKLDNARRQHDQVVRLQDTGNLLEPNLIVLSKLSEEMKKVCLEFPPKKFLFGLSPHATGLRFETKSVPTQTIVDIPPPMPVMHINPVASHYYPPAVQPLMHSGVNQPPHFIPTPAPPPNYNSYQSPQFYPNHQRKRSRHDEASSSGSYPPQRPPY